MSEQSTPASAPEQINYRDVPGFPGYRVGDDGSVWSRLVDAWNQKGKGAVAGRMREEWRRLKATRSKSRKYLSVELRLDGRGFTRAVHVLVLLAFRGPRPLGKMARHLDDDRDNNALSNLAWGTIDDNAKDAIRNGRIGRGEQASQAKLTAELVIEARKLKREGWTWAAIGRQVGVSRNAARLAVQGKTWGHVREVVV